MPKVILFNESKVLRELRWIFRKKGFHGTTLQDLCKGTGLNPGSLYNSFGNKEELFNVAVVSYNQIAIEERALRLLKAQPSAPFEGLRRFLKSTFQESERVKIGCLITNSVAEFDVLPRSAQKKIEIGLDLLREHFYRYLREEIHVNGVELNLDIDLSVQFLFAQYQGFLILVKLKKDDAFLRDHIEKVVLPILSKGCIE